MDAVLKCAGLWSIAFVPHGWMSGACTSTHWRYKGLCGGPTWSSNIHSDAQHWVLESKLIACTMLSAWYLQWKPRAINAHKYLLQASNVLPGRVNWLSGFHSLTTKRQHFNETSIIYRGHLWGFIECCYLQSFHGIVVGQALSWRRSGVGCIFLQGFPEGEIPHHFLPLWQGLRREETMVKLFSGGRPNYINRMEKG